VEALEKAQERAGGREKGGVSVDIRVGMCIFTQPMTNPVFYFHSRPTGRLNPERKSGLVLS
jgi:hypothetical protein